MRDLVAKVPTWPRRIQAQKVFVGQKHVHMTERHGQLRLRGGKGMRRPGIEPGSHPWQGCMIPLHHRRLIFPLPDRTAYVACYCHLDGVVVAVLPFTMPWPSPNGPSREQHRFTCLPSHFSTSDIIFKLHKKIMDAAPSSKNKFGHNFTPSKVHMNRIYFAWQ